MQLICVLSCSNHDQKPDKLSLLSGPYIFQLQPERLQRLQCSGRKRLTLANTAHKLKVDPLVMVSRLVKLTVTAVVQRWRASQQQRLQQRLPGGSTHSMSLEGQGCRDQGMAAIQYCGRHHPATATTASRMRWMKAIIWR